MKDFLQNLQHCTKICNYNDVTETRA